MVAEVKKYKNGTIRIKVNCLAFNFFNSEDYIIKTFENGFSISKPTLDYIGKSYRMTRRKDNYISISTAKDIEDGIYVLDEESNEDISFFINSDYLDR